MKLGRAGAAEAGGPHYDASASHQAERELGEVTRHLKRGSCVQGPGRSTGQAHVRVADRGHWPDTCGLQSRRDDTIVTSLTWPGTDLAAA